jgi:hypothetical protein
MRGFADAKILASRNSIQEFASYATDSQGLRVSNPVKGSEQKDHYFFPNTNFLVYFTMTGLQVLYTFILSQLVVPQWINPLNPAQDDNTFSPAFLMRFGSQENRSWATTSLLILLIIMFPFIGVHIINTVSGFVVRVRVLKISELSIFIPQYICDVFFLPNCCRPGKGDIIATTHLLPSIPLQMPGPATNSLVLSVAIHPKPSEVGTGMSLKRLRWGVVRRPSPRFEAASSPAFSKQGPYANEDDRSLSWLLHNEPAIPYKTAVVSSERPIEALHRAPTSTSTFSIKRKPLEMVSSPDFLRHDLYANQEDYISSSPLLNDSRYTFQGSPVSPQRPPEKLYRASTSTSTFNIKRKALPSSFVTEIGEKIEDRWRSEGHCTFSAEPVDELEQGRFYTGIRRDENHTMWLKGGSTGFKRRRMDIYFRLRPRRTTVYAVPSMSPLSDGGVCNYGE